MLWFVNFSTALVCIIFVLTYIISTLSRNRKSIEDDDKPAPELKSTTIITVGVVLFAIWFNIATYETRNTLVDDFISGGTIYCSPSFESKHIKVNKQDDWQYYDNTFSNEKLGYKIHIQNCSKEF